MGRSGRGTGGGSSGGRSFSSGGGRSFSGGMHSSGRSSGGGYRRSSGNSYTNIGSYPGRRLGYSGYRASWPVTIIILVIVVIAFLASTFGQSSGTITKSTVDRKPLPLSQSTEVQYFTDTLGWISKPGTLEKGMREFYKRTGVQPHLYIVDNIAGDSSPDNASVERWMSSTYDKLFSDEAHLLVLFLDNGSDYGKWLMGGTETKTVLDSEATAIIQDYIDLYYYSDMEDGDMFSAVFLESSNRIMTVTKSLWSIVAIGVVVIVILLILNVFWRWKKHQQNFEAEQTAAILNTPLEEIEDSDTLSDLEKKYKNRGD